MKLKRGTRIEVAIYHMDGTTGGEPATIVRKGHPDLPDGYYLIRFADSGKLHVHQESFRVTDNRMAA